MNELGEKSRKDYLIFTKQEEKDMVDKKQRKSTQDDISLSSIESNTVSKS